MIGVVVLVKDGYGQIRGEDGRLYDFAREGDNALLRPAHRVSFTPVNRFARWRALDVERIPASPTTDHHTQGATP